MLVPDLLEIKVGTSDVAFDECETPCMRHGSFTIGECWLVGDDEVGG